MPVDPSSLQIVHYPAEVLRQKADPVDPTDEVRAVVDRMIEIMRQEDGIGLAAPQVGLPWRIFICDVPPSNDPGDDRDPNEAPPTASNGVQAFLNPEIIDPEGPLTPYEEGCLSLPDITGDVQRPEIVTIRATTPAGEKVEMRAAGLLARCWQHELDHLDGILIIDKMSQMGRLKMRSAIRKLEKRAGRR